MLREYVVHLLETRFPVPMKLAYELIETYGLLIFLEDEKIQHKLYEGWMPYFDYLPRLRGLKVNSTVSNNFSHYWYLQKFLISLHRSIFLKQYQQLARIHSMLIDITIQQHALLKLCLYDYESYIKWQRDFCYQQYQIAFKSLQ